jgi:hypothetical protein
LAVAFVVASLVTLANPAGVAAYAAYFAAGHATPALEVVADEWTPVPLFHLPAPPNLPSPLAWSLAWAMLVAVALALIRAIRRGRVEPAGFELDPALIGVSLLSLALVFSAVRFSWLGIFPLLLVATAIGAPGGLASSPRTERHRETAIAAAAGILAVGFFYLGDWPAITRGLPATWEGYARPYPRLKYHAHAIWLLSDSRLRGNLYTPYFLGGFAGYWLAPSVHTLVNGSLNVPKETFEALGAIAQGRGQAPGEDLTDLLDRTHIDLFLGIGLPEPTRRGNRWTSAQLEDTPGWIPIFRNIECALYLRANERNRDNLERIAEFYRAERVPFDLDRGFEIDAVIRDTPEWAVRHGVIWPGFPAMARAAAIRQDPRVDVLRDRVASLYAVLGRYDRAVEIDRSLLRADPDAVRPRRRLVWSLLRLGRAEEAASAARALEAQPAADGLTQRIANAAREVQGLGAEQARAAAAELPLLSGPESSSLIDPILQPPFRPPR